MPNHRPDEQSVVAAVGSDPIGTAQAWGMLDGKVLELDWPQICMLVVQHRVEGLFVDALNVSDWYDQVPPSVLSMLRYRARLAEVRVAAIRDKVALVHSQAPDLLQHLVLYKGITMTSLYSGNTHRMVSDLDVVVSEADFPAVRQELIRAGFTERDSVRGSSFYAEPVSPQVGCDYVMFDLHFEPLPRFTRSSVADSVWRTAEVEPFDVIPGRLQAQRFAPNHAVLIALVYLAEHAASWIQTCLEDDIRLIKMIDIELLCRDDRVNAGRIWELAVRAGVAGMAMLGLALLRAIRVGVPPPLLTLVDRSARLDGLCEMIALPDGTLGRWSTPVAERAFRTDRSTTALRMVPGPHQRRRDWHDVHGLPRTDVEAVSAIRALADERCNLET